jgi:hypothetical protein
MILGYFKILPFDTNLLLLFNDFNKNLISYQLFMTHCLGWWTQILKIPWVGYLHFLLVNEKLFYHIL